MLHAFASPEEARLAYDEGQLELHVPILVRMTATVDGETRHKLVRTTVGRLIFNEGIPQDLGFVDRDDPDGCFEPEINFVCGKKQLGKIIDKCILTPWLYPVGGSAGYHQGPRATTTPPWAL